MPPKTQMLLRKTSGLNKIETVFSKQKLPLMEIKDVYEQSAGFRLQVNADWISVILKTDSGSMNLCRLQFSDKSGSISAQAIHNWSADWAKLMMNGAYELEMVKSGKDLEFPPVKEYNGQIFLSINASCKFSYLGPLIDGIPRVPMIMLQDVKKMTVSGLNNIGCFGLITNCTPMPKPIAGETQFDMQRDFMLELNLQSISVSVKGRQLIDRFANVCPESEDKYMLISNGAIYKDEDGEPFILVDSKNASCELHGKNSTNVDIKKVVDEKSKCERLALAAQARDKLIANQASKEGKSVETIVVNVNCEGEKDEEVAILTNNDDDSEPPFLSDELEDEGIENTPKKVKDPSVGTSQSLKHPLPFDLVVTDNKKTKVVDEERSA